MSFGYTTDPSKRDAFDDYPTDSRWVDVLLDNTDTRLKDLPTNGQRVFDLATNGNGSQLHDALVARGANSACAHLDFFDREAVREVTGDEPYHHVTNPPYRCFNQWALEALEVTPGCVALLGGIHALSSKGRRRDLWVPHRPTEVLVVVNNQKVLGKTSQFAHVWFVWDSKRTPTATLKWVEADTSKPALHPSLPRESE